KALQAGEGCYATLLTPQGHIVADLYALRMDDHVLLECDWLRKEPLRQTLEKYIIADQVEMGDLSGRLASLSVEGPQSGPLLTAAGAITLPGQELNHTWVELAGTPVHVTRQSETGEEGYRLHFVAEYAQNVWDALVAQQKVVPWKPVGRAALNILRTEAGVPWFGAELDESTLPPEAGLEATAISYQKGCYVGQEIIERIRSRGHVNRKLTGLRLEAEPLPAAGAKLLAGGKEAGHLTTVVNSPALGGPIALGYVRRQHLEPRTALELESGGTARVAELPFYRAARPALERR
ncbi:MAG: YgfZ/GcvT domain-containing protein, partial [Terriglobia bacterium]